MKSNKLVKYLITSLILSITACTQATTQVSQLASKTSDSNTVYNLNLGPKGGGTIDPKITAGQTVVNFKEGDGVLLFNINLKSASGTGFTTKAETTTTATGANTITIVPSIAPTTSATPTPTPTASASATTNTISKIANEIYINNKKYTLDIPADKISGEKYILNLAGLKKGSIVSLASEVFDSKDQSVGKESVLNKEVKEDVESFDLNISVKIEINVSQKTEVNTSVNVSQSQVVSPIINITLPTPAQGQQQQNGQQPPPPPPQKKNCVETPSDPCRDN